MKKIAMALAGGVLMGLTQAPVSAWYLAWIALVPLWILIIQEEKWRLIYPLAWGCGYYGIALFWLTGIHPMTWMGVPWLASLAIAIACWVFVTLYGTALVIVWSILMRLLNKYFSLKNAVLNILAGVTIWCVLEKIWSLTPLWWASLASTQSPHNLIILQLGQISGISTITASILTINGLVAVALTGEKTRNEISIANFKKRVNFLPIILIIIIFSCLHLIGFYLYNRPLINVETAAIKVGIIQGNIPNSIKLYAEGWRKAIQGYTTGYKILADDGVDIILTPETALPFFWDELATTKAPFYEAILEKKVPAWVGAFGKEGNSYTNSLFSITGDGKVFSRYDKIKLVPLGEYIPFENILGSIINRLSPIEAHLKAGQPNQVFDTPFGRAIVGICYESAFSEHFRRQAFLGGTFIITSSNNAHYSAVMPAQHHALDVMRAIETDRWAARATNTGYSAIVNPRGQTLWISGINTYELHKDIIYARDTETLYVKWGDWLTILLFVATILMLTKVKR